MENMYYCMVKDGPYPPKMIWKNYFDALNEAKRLQLKFNKPVKVLRVVASLEFEEVPVTKSVPITKFYHRDTEGVDDLPF